MTKREKKAGLPDLLWLTVGSALFIFVGWRWNIAIAAWLSLVFLIRFFRSQDRWHQTLVALPFVLVASFITVATTWDFFFFAEAALSALWAAPFLVALYADRFFHSRIRGQISTFVFPSVYVAVDFFLSFLPTGTWLSVSVTQFPAATFIQLASVTGIWGISFMVCWCASTINTWWENGFGLGDFARPVYVFTVFLVSVLFLGGYRLAVGRPDSDTVRIGAVTVEHATDYWGQVIDKGTPREAVERHRMEFEELEERLFADSAKAVRAGARIVFWSEGNAVLHEDDERGFVERAKAFAQENQVYLMPAMLVLRTGETSGENKVIMIEPSGGVAFSYTKTKDWYPTESDGVLPLVSTPYGQISAAICYDMDFPSFVRQAGKNEVDIMLVPAFDWEAIRFHAQIGLLRGIENGFSIVRQTNQGTSIAVDYQGNVLAYQDFFTTPDRVMIVDVPTEGAKTVYSVLGDWFAYIAILFVLVLLVWAIWERTARSRHRA